MTIDSTRYPMLKARVEPLGYQLFRDDSTAKGNITVDGDEIQDMFFVYDPKVDLIILTQVNHVELETWLVDHETDAADTVASIAKEGVAAAEAAKKWFETQAETGRLYPTDTEEERFLNLIVIANPKDRFKAMDIRKAKGVKAAIAYIGKCSVTDEAYESSMSKKSLGDRLTGDEQSVVYAIQGVTIAIAQEVHQLDYDKDKRETMLAGLTIALEVLADMMPAQL